MRRDSPFFSIGIPRFDHARCIGKTVESVLWQRFGDFEVVVAQNASTDLIERGGNVELTANLEQVTGDVQGRGSGDRHAAGGEPRPVGATESWMGKV